MADMLDGSVIKDQLAYRREAEQKHRAPGRHGGDVMMMVQNKRLLMEILRWHLLYNRAVQGQLRPMDTKLIGALNEIFESQNIKLRRSRVEAFS